MHAPYVCVKVHNRYITLYASRPGRGTPLDPKVCYVPTGPTAEHRIHQWFGHFLSDTAKFPFGAGSLANYALAHRMEVPTRQAQTPCHRLECSCGHQHAPELPSAVCKAVCTATQQYGPQMWDLLVWKGAHPQSPVSVSAKPRYFAELDLPATIHNLLEDGPEFWASPEFEQPLQDIAALVPDWVQQVPPALPGMPVC